MLSRQGKAIRADTCLDEDVAKFTELRERSIHGIEGMAENKSQQSAFVVVIHPLSTCSKRSTETEANMCKCLEHWKKYYYTKYPIRAMSKKG